MRIYEIYRSIQGESTYAGLPCTFIRTAGCSLRCVYCDTGYALPHYSGEEIEIETILSRIETMGVDLVEITGGEPLEQADTPLLCERLIGMGATVLVETSGAFPIDQLPQQTIKIMDLKTPSSRMVDHNNYSNLSLLSPKDEVKFVISDRSDFEWALDICRRYGLFNKHTLLFSPSFNRMPPDQLAQWIIDEKIPVRLQIQQHKYIWSPTTRGV